MASDASARDLLDTAALLAESADVLEGLAVAADQFPALRDRIRTLRERRGLSPSARPRRVQRLRSEENNGYPLRRALLVVFNRDGWMVTAEFREATSILKIRGVGRDEESALRDLEGRCEQVIREKVRIPPHARRAEDLPVLLLVNALIDWEQFERENPLPRLLWGQVVKHGLLGRPRVRWLLGPGGIREQTATLPRAYNNALLADLPPGRWFRAVVKEYPDRVEWVERPYEVPDPEDAEERRKAWEAIPTAYADQPNVWPLKDE